MISILYKEKLLWTEKKNACFVFLSATVPNAKEFVDWVEKAHKQQCHMVYPNCKSSPFQHYLFLPGGHELYLVVDEIKNFHEDNFQKL